MSNLYYLASPYSHDSADVREDRFHAACVAAAALMRVGVNVFSPIAISHPIATIGGIDPHHECWCVYDLCYLPFCAGMIVLQLPGWMESRGIAGEIRAMREARKPIVYVGLDDVMAAPGQVKRVLEAMR
jgi:hypothetical protein